MQLLIFLPRIKLNFGQEMFFELILKVLPMNQGTIHSGLNQSGLK
jgi:hypothetical protein